ncbi:MAG TPA: polysaccharide deacetylase family protein [Thermoanaerobaculia bacterium]|jgi:peptidoglycan/xylan/chitin deacetylase (PgdA/CDA1 family)|nr:polysaccharide deacetylase family protein [Thermoanaerobaculia bacterium]
MRRLIIAFAFVAPVLLLATWRHSPWLAIGILALSHALLLYPTLRPNVQWLGPVITRFATEAKEVWLTIDDGPTDDTPAILDLLDARGAKATFFVKGVLAEQHPERMGEIVARGHSVANHSRTHPAGTFWCLPPSRLAEEIDGCRVAGPWFRAPVGMKNPFVHPLLARRGLRLIGWTVRGFDSIVDDASRVAGRIVPRVSPGAIVVMHQGRSWSVGTIGRVVDELQQRGYAFVIPNDTQLKT